MERSLNGRKRNTFMCEGYLKKTKDESGKEKLVFIKGCGFTFKTCGKPLECPKCHTQLGTVEKE